MITDSDLGTVVVPCFNEERRIDTAGFAELIEGGLDVMFVDDGSTDGTVGVLKSICASNARAELLELGENRGKGEAVRAGLREAIGRGAPMVGYLDADLSTPPSEYLSLAKTLHDRADLQACLGSRVGLLGREIHRRAWRHYAGRVFATAASIAIGVRVYDTQCGAKVFRASAALNAALARPFESPWVFDVELLQRLLDHGVGSYPAREVPLESWSDIDGSKLGLPAMTHAALDLWQIWITRVSRRRLSGSGALQSAWLRRVCRAPASRIASSSPPTAPNAANELETQGLNEGRLSESQTVHDRPAGPVPE